MNKLKTLSLTLLIVSCTSATLKPGAEKVVLSEKDPAANCKKVGQAESYATINLAGSKKKDILLRLLKNQAIDKGGNYVKLEIISENKYAGPIFQCPYEVAGTLSVEQYCSSIKKGQKLAIDSEQKNIQQLKLESSVALAATRGHDTKMLMISSKNSNKKCDIVIQDGKVLEIRNKL